jgi:hypothetical protein
MQWMSLGLVGGPRQRHGADAEPPFHDGEANHRPLGGGRPDVAARLDDPLPAGNRAVPEPTIVATGYAWATLLAALGLANLITAWHSDFVTWAWFVSVGSVGAKLAAFALQYGVFRAIIRQRVAQSMV